MQQELAAKLFESYPDLLKNLDYFGVGDGWYDFLDHLFHELSSYDIRVVQVKEKFAYLRVYYDINGNLSDTQIHKIDAIIREFESNSGRICEECGKPGGKRSCKGWLRILCDEHYSEFLSRHESR